MASYIAAGAIILIALMHSVLGEREILGPLFAREWSTPVPRWAMERLLRFAWHLTSIAWVAMGATLLGASAHDALAACALLSGGVIFIMLRGHIAWPLFLICGVAALLGADHLPAWAVSGVIHAAALVCVVVGAVHVYWALGGERGVRDAIPETSAESSDARGSLFTPPPAITMAVALALFSLAALLLWSAWMPLDAWHTWALGAAGAAMSLRSLGDGKYVGLTKSVRDTRFGMLDDRFYTPLTVLLAFGCGGGLLLGHVFG